MIETVKIALTYDHILHPVREMDPLKYADIGKLQRVVAFAFYCLATIFTLGIATALYLWAAQKKITIQKQGEAAEAAEAAEPEDLAGLSASESSSEPVVPDDLSSDESSEGAAESSTESTSAQKPKQPETDGSPTYLELLDKYLEDGANLSGLQEEIPGDELKNTKLTDMLQYFAFGQDKQLYTDNVGKLNQFLQKLALAAENDESIRQALIMPNYATQAVFSAEKIRAGIPRNTPLLFLIKRDNLKGALTILSCYQRGDLLFADSRGNSALHIAVKTGQLYVAFAIIRRAEELGCLDELLNLQNRVSKSAQDMYRALFDTQGNRIGWSAGALRF